MRTLWCRLAHKDHWRADGFGTCQCRHCGEVHNADDGRVGRTMRAVIVVTVAVVVVAAILASAPRCRVESGKVEVGHVMVAGCAGESAGLAPPKSIVERSASRR